MCAAEPLIATATRKKLPGREVPLSDLFVEVFKYLALSLVVVLGTYVVLRVGTIAVLQSIDEFRRRGEES